MTGSTLWWMSFAEESGFLGVVITEAGDVVGAVRKAHRLKVNPGGQVAAVPMHPDAPIGREWRDRLLSEAQVQELNGLLGAQGQERKGI